MDYEIFDLGINRGFGTGGYGVYPPPPRHDEPSVRLNRCQLNDITTLYKRLAQHLNEPRSNLRIPIERLMTSLTENDPIHKIIDLGIAFESLYVPDSQGEVNMRFALHAAWHLGKSKAERMELRSVKGGAMKDHRGGEKLYHLAPLFSINVRANC